MLAEYFDLIDKDRLRRFHSNLKANGLPLNDWQSLKKYKVGSCIKHEGKLYVCNTEHTSGIDFDVDKWDSVGGSSLNDWQALEEYNVGQNVVYNDLIYKCITTHTSTDEFDYTKWKCLSGEIVGTYAKRELIWEGTYNTSNQSSTTLTNTLELPVSIEHYDQLEITMTGNVPDNDYTIGLVNVADVEYGKTTMRLQSVATNAYFGTMNIAFTDSTHLAICFLDQAGWAGCAIKKIVGVKFNNSVVSSGMVHETLWSGSVGNKTGSGTYSITLSASWKKYKKLGLYLTTSILGDNSDRVYYRELETEQFNEFLLAENSDACYSFCWGHADLNDVFEFQSSCTEINLNFVCNKTIITKVIGISEGVYIPTGIQADIVTLFEGSVGNFSSSGATQINLNDSYKNYDTLGFYNIVSNSGNKRYIYREVKVSQINDLIDSSDSGATVTMCWGWFNKGDYVDIQSTSTDIRLDITYSDSLVTKVVGIKYTSPSLDKIQEWEPTKNYSMGDYVVKDNQIYHCDTAHTSSTWSVDIDNWTMISGLQTWQGATTYKEGSLIYNEGKLYKVTNSFTSTSTFDTTNLEMISGGGLSDWKANTKYQVDDAIVYEGEIYKVVTAFTSGLIEGSVSKVNDIIPTMWIPSTSFIAGDIIEHQDRYYEVTDDFTSGALFEVVSEMNELQIVEVVAPKSLTEEEIDELVEAFNPSGKGINTVLYNDTPIGTIISYMGITPPRDYLICDGTTYSISSYNELAEYIKKQFGSYNYFGGDGTTTFAVPDLRGEFLRGSGINSHVNQGSGANVGIHQDGTLLSSIWKTSDSNMIVAENINLADDSGALNYDAKVSMSSSFRDIGVKQSDRTSPFPITRPTNTSVLFCIKYNTTVLSVPENNYSTEEKKIGTWIDGKPLYQRTYHLINPATNLTPMYIEDSENYDYCMIVDNYYKTNLSEGSFSWYADSTNRGCIFIWRGNSSADDSRWGFWCSLPDSNLIVSDIYVTVKYTKTTD